MEQMIPYSKVIAAKIKATGKEIINEMLEAIRAYPDFDYADIDICPAHFYGNDHIESGTIRDIRKEGDKIIYTLHTEYDDYDGDLDEDELDDRSFPIPTGYVKILEFLEEQCKK